MILVPSQQSAFAASQQQQWPLPPKPTPLTSFWPSTDVTALSISTRKSQISSTTSHISCSRLPQHPYHCTPMLSMHENEIQLSSSSRKKAPASRCSSVSLRWLTTTLLSSKGSMRTHHSPPIPSLIGNNHHWYKRQPGLHPTVIAATLTTPM